MDTKVIGRARWLFLAWAGMSWSALFAANVLENVRTNTCEIRVIRDDAVANDRYFWTGGCMDGLAQGHGWLFRYYVDAAGRASQPNRVWETVAREGRMEGGVRRYGAGWYWTWWADHPVSSSQPIQVYPRHMLSTDMQKALNRAATAINAHGVLPIPVQEHRVLCPKEIEVTAASGERVSFNVQGYISSKKTFEAAKRELAASLMQIADSVDPGNRSGTSLRLIASAVVGCQLSIAR